MPGNDNAPGAGGVTRNQYLAGGVISASPSLQGGTVTAYDRFIGRVRDDGKTVRETRSGQQAMAQCPAHDDHDPSLSIRRIEGQALIHCHAGCDSSDVLGALGMTMSDLFDDPKGATYRYDDGRIVQRTPTKRFRQSGNTKGTAQLYRRDRVTQAVRDRQLIYLPEGEKDVHALESLGVVATTAPMGAKNFDKVDVSPLVGAKIKVVVDNDDAGRDWQRQVTEKLEGVAASLELYRAKVGKDAADHIAAGYGLEDLEVIELGPKITTLAEAHAVFKGWLGDDYDLDALDAMLAAAAVERLDGDPVWLLIISGSGNAKTETVQALSGIGATVVSTITSEGALLSATSKRERAKDATGGLLQEIGDRGVLVVKDVTSILSMNRDLRAQVLGAFREIHDGSWVRKVGTDGGRSLPWSGRIAVIGAVTTAWDQAHAVIASMGDRFVLVRVDSTTGRQAAGRKAIGNTGVEERMRAELAAAVAGVLAGMETTGITLTEEETDLVLAAADLVTLARTGVEYDYKGDVVDAHAPEMPTRFAKELTQIIRGAVAIGIERHEALRLAIRCARDSMPPLRLKVIDDLARDPGSTTGDVRRRVNKPWHTVDRQLQALHMLGVLDVVEDTYGEKTRWHYSLVVDIDPKALDPDSLPEMSVPTPNPQEERDRESNKDYLVGDISGEDQAPAPAWPVFADGAVQLDLLSDASCPSCDRPLDLPNPRCSVTHGYSEGMV
jgi:hypothetical protein